MHVRTRYLNKEKAVCRDCGREFKCRSYLATHRQAVHDASGIRFFERSQIFRAKIQCDHDVSTENATKQTNISDPPTMQHSTANQSPGETDIKKSLSARSRS